METANLITVENRAGLSDTEFEALARHISTHGSLRVVLRWLAGLNPPRVPEDAIAQDEFSHDVIAAIDGGLYLAYDST